MRKLQTQGVHHITLVGADRQTSIDFWEGVLGMPFVFEQPNLDNAGESHLYFDPGDGRLDVVIATGESRLEFLALLPAIRAGTHLDDEHVRYFRASRLEVATNEHLAVNADGEAVTGQRFSYGLLPRRLKLLVPAT